MKTNVFLAPLLTFCILLPALAQTKPAPRKTDDDDDVVKITTNLVQVDAVVTKDGKIVPNLTADDFEIYEDGKKQTITSFAFISNVPGTSAPPEKVKPTDSVPFAPLKRDDPRRTIALVVDDLGLSAESIHSVRQQLRKFIAEELQPNDIVAIIRTGGELGALQQFTNDKRLLNRAVDRLRWNLCSRVGVHVIPHLRAGPIHHPGDSCGGGSYYQTIKSVRFILDAMGELPGRKSMVLLSDSTPREDQEIRLTDESLGRLPMNVNYSGLLQKIAEKAIRSSVVIYSVDTQGLQYTGLTAADHVAGSGRNLSSTSMHAVMSMRSDMLWNRREGGEIIARQTGGFQIRNSNSFELSRILQDQSGYYLLGYRPTAETFNRRFHHIKAKVKRSGMTLRTRFGFFGVSEEQATPAQVSNRNATNLALMSPFAAQDIEVNLTSFFTNDKVSGSVIRSFVYIDPKGLTFEAADGRHQASIELHGVIFGDNGTVVEQLSQNANLSLSESDYHQAMQNGMALRFDMSVKRAGAYQVRIAARDRVSSKIGSAGEFVDVPDLRNKKLAVSGIVLGTTARFSGRDVNEIIEFPGTRSFEPNSDLHFAFVTYNATSTSNLVMEARLFRDGKNVQSGRETPILIDSDPSRLLVSGSVRLNSDLEVGNYYLQVVITDKNAKDKAAPLVQWIDFAIMN